MISTGQPVRFGKPDEELAGALFVPESQRSVPTLIVCHGAGEFKENYFELCRWLLQKGIATLALDLYGHGQSMGKRFHVDMREWVQDIREAIDFLATEPKVNSDSIGAFGLSSGGTAV